MKQILFTALLGCLVVQGFAQQQTNPIRITDSNGMCWICQPNRACEPCSSSGPLAVVPDLDWQCQMPTAVDCSTAGPANLLLPSLDPAYFWQCAPRSTMEGLIIWAPVHMPCACGLFFDYFQQRCEEPWNTAFACELLEVPVRSPLQPPFCEDTSIPPTDPPTEPTVSPPTEPAVTEIPVTTAPPCNCIPWIPCWCMPNPCANMPCGNCNGCQG